MSEGGRAEEQKAGRAEEHISLSSPQKTAKSPDVAGNDSFFFLFKRSGFD